MLRDNRLPSFFFYFNYLIIPLLCHEFVLTFLSASISQDSPLRTKSCTEDYLLHHLLLFPFLFFLFLFFSVYLRGDWLTKQKKKQTLLDASPGDFIVSGQHQQQQQGNKGRQRGRGSGCFAMHRVTGKNK